MEWVYNLIENTAINLQFTPSGLSLPDSNTL